VPAPPGTPPAPADPALPADLGDAGKKAIQAERDARRQAEKERNDYAARLKEIEDRDKTEAQKAADRAEAAEKALAEMTTRALRLQIGAEVGIPADMYEFLTGSDEASLREQAQKLADRLGAATAPPAPGKPKPDPSQGARPDGAAPPQLTRADLVGMSPEEITKAKSEGRLNDLLGIK
jgi:hypothetical protein